VEARVRLAAADAVDEVVQRRAEQHLVTAPEDRRRRLVEEGDPPVAVQTADAVRRGAQDELALAVQAIALVAGLHALGDVLRRPGHDPLVLRPRPDLDDALLAVGPAHALPEHER
jgi:hypothetical protein